MCDSPIQNPGAPDRPRRIHVRANRPASPRGGEPRSSPHSPIFLARPVVSRGLVALGQVGRASAPGTHHPPRRCGHQAGEGPRSCVAFPGHPEDGARSCPATTVTLRRPRAAGGGGCSVRLRPGRCCPLRRRPHGPARRTSPRPPVPGAVRRGGRSPEAPVPPAPVESVDRWPLASIDTQIPGGRPLAGAAVRRRVRGCGTPHQGRLCRSLPAPARASDSLLRRTAPWRTSVGAIGWSRRAPRCAAEVSGGRALVAPSSLTVFCPSGGCALGPPPRRGPRGPGR
ncbi:hypothetical protein VTN02DRAFT_676 [Thermoascus thermophilus]